MGCSYRAHAVLGIKLSHAELFHPKKIKVFEHNFPEDWLVDPKTGKQLWSSYPVCVLNNSEELYDKVNNEIDVVNNGEERSSKQFYYLGKIVSDGEYHDSENFLGIWNTDALKNHLQQLLEPHKLWFPERFGLWAVQYISC